MRPGLPSAQIGAEGTEASVEIEFKEEPTKRYYNFTAIGLSGGFPVK
jgi:hypothetical protein